MKEVIIIIIILMVIISGDILINNYLRKSSQSLIGNLKILKEEMNREEIKEEINKEELVKKENMIYDNWQKIEEKWAIMVLHSELDLIETSLIKMKTEIEEDNLDIAKEELETSIFLINHISEKEKFCIKNIF